MALYLHDFKCNALKDIPLHKHRFNQNRDPARGMADMIKIAYSVATAARENELPATSVEWDKKVVYANCETCNVKQPSS